MKSKMLELNAAEVVGIAVSDFHAIFVEKVTVDGSSRSADPLVRGLDVNRRMNLVGRPRRVQNYHSSLPATNASAVRLREKHGIFRSLLDAAGRRTCTIASRMRVLQNHIDGAGRVSRVPASTGDECGFRVARSGDVNVLVRRDM